MDEKISQLHIYLEHLPTSLPSSDPLGSYARLLNFTPDEDWLKDIGEEGAVNRELELALGRRDDNNTFPIQERGHCIEALANILEKYLAIYPNSVLLMKWLDAAHSSAKQCINGVDPEKTDQLDGMHASDHDASSRGPKRRSPPAESSTSGPSKKKATTKRADSKVLIDEHDSDFITSDEDPDERNGGGKMFPLLKLITKPCRRKKAPSGEEGRKYVSPAHAQKRVW